MLPGNLPHIGNTNYEEYRSLYSQNIRNLRHKGKAAGKGEASLADGMQAIPSCKTFAAVIERATGKMPFWSQCLEPRDDVAFFKQCVESVSPAFVNPNRLKLPECIELQRAYSTGISYSQAIKINADDIVSPDCEFVYAAAKSWRRELPAFLKVCEAYDPNNTAEHLNNCLSSENQLVRLRDCQSVRSAYERNLDLANGYRPKEYIPLPCDQTQAILAKAEQVREKRKKEAEEKARALEERKRKVAQQQQERIDAIKQAMAEKYADTPEAVATRTSPLEKKAQANDGKFESRCASPKYDSIYCPPTLEEIRLAVMRYNADDSGNKLVNGHLIHGKQSNLLMTLGFEAKYGDARLVRQCKREPDYYECQYILPMSFHYDQLSQLYMDGWSQGAPIDFNSLILDKMGAATKTERNHYKFWRDSQGLWQAQPTKEQLDSDFRKEVKSFIYSHL